MDIQKIISQINACNDPELLRGWIKNAKRHGEATVEDAAMRKLISIVPEEEPGTVGHDFWTTVHAFEYVLTEENGKTTRLSRTRQKVKRDGVVATLASWAESTKPKDGFNMLMERGMPELTGEAIVLRHQTDFEPGVIEAARARLEAAGVDLDQIQAPNH
ncbi:hypothetical protein [Maricaulis sp.]|uniref:hypothetical protein n=1 Tax=Maricaulis sp. TaxID=1486257 RepID=UPI003A9091ED